MVAPIVVVEGPEEAFTRVASELRAAGWNVTDGFERQVPRVDRAVRSGTVAGPRDAAAALLAALDGVGLVIHGCAPRSVLDRLLDDLRHVGPVEHRRRLEPAPPALDADELAILRMLGEGQRLGDAADALGLSRRTADRRLAAARRALGTERTVEAVSRARRLGWLR
ncbi:MAG TPA: hypothetical protein VIF63_06565 [Candidatus Limnocylindrales bacterium]|jgi:DNA-binding NarL/FixJ family response regulator